MRTPIVHGVHGVSVAHQTHPTPVRHDDAQWQSSLDLTQGRRPHKSVRQAHASVLTDGIASIGPSSSAALSVCHASDAHFTRTGKRDTPENTTS